MTLTFEEEISRLTDSRPPPRPPAPAPPRLICSWCLAVMQEGDETQPASHGICPACIAKLEGGFPGTSGRGDLR